MAKQAKYTVHVPTHDNLGRPLRDLATATHEHLYRNGAIEGSYIEPNKRGNWRNYPQETMDHLVAFAEDTPEIDSHMKQAAAHLGQLAGQEAVTVTKEGKDGPALWIINNPEWQEGQGAHPSALQYVPAAQRQPDAPVSQPEARTSSLAEFLDTYYVPS